MTKDNALVLSRPVFKVLKINLSLKLFWILVSVVILALLIACVFQLNAYTREFYLTQEYQNKISQLLQENKMLEINFSQLNSLQNIGSYVQNQVFEKAEKVEYIQLLGGTALAK